MRNTFKHYDPHVPVIANLKGSLAPRMIGMDLTLITPDEDGKLYILPDEFLASVPGSSLGRILPRTLTAGAIAASATTLLVDRAKNFVEGDVLRVLAPMAKINIASASAGWVAGDTITFTLAGYALIYTVVSGDVGGTLTETNANIAAKIVLAIAADPYLSQVVDSLSAPGATTTSDVFVWAKDFLSSYTVAAADTGTNGTATIGGSLTNLKAMQTIGTIAADGVNTTTDTLTISAASINLPDGMPIGVAGPVPLALSGAIVDLENESETVSGYTNLVVYKERLHYWDGELDRLFPGIEFQFAPA